MTIPLILAGAVWLALIPLYAARAIRRWAELPRHLRPYAVGVVILWPLAELLSLATRAGRAGRAAARSGVFK